MQGPSALLNVITVPPGATITSPRVVIDGVRGAIFVYQSGGPVGALIGSWAGTAGTDPYGNVYPAGIDVASGAITGTVFTGTDFIMSSSGLFFYAGTPALNNLIASVVPGIVSITDSVGNTALPGIASYGGAANKWIAMSIQQGGLINWYIMATASMNGAWTAIGQIAPPGDTLSPMTLTNNNQGFLINDAFNVSDTTHNINLQAFLINLGGIGNRGVYVLGPVSGAAEPFLFTGDPVLGAPNAEVWHDMRPLSNSFVGSIASRYPPQYRRTIDGFVEIFGFVQFPPSGGPNFNNITFANLPAAYRSGSNTGAKWPIILETNVTPIGTPNCQIDSAGNIQFHNLPTSGLLSTIACISGRFPIDATGLIVS